jgi:two-component system, cell cycle sensor histidine kinase and response regulator CckA
MADVVMIKNRNSVFPIWVIVALLAAAGLLFGGSLWFYRSQEREVYRAAEEQLSSIARLKVDRIAAWRAERQADAAVLMEEPLLARTASRFLSDSADDESRSLLLSRFGSLQHHYHYVDVLLVDAAGQVRLSLSGDDTISAQLGSAGIAAQQQGKPVFSDIYAEDEDGALRIGVFAPLLHNAAMGGEPFGAVVMMSDVSRFLYPLVEFWPTSSSTAETLMVQRDGENVLFLNDLRHQADTALTLRIPLSRTDVPAVMAIQGRQGVVRGRDYRDMEVVSVILPIPDSPWFLVTKQDADEVYAEWRSRARLILGLLAALTAGLGGFVLLAWQRNAKAHYRSLYRVLQRQRLEEMRHSIVLKAIGDAVIVVDTKGRVELLNPVAEALTGWRLEEARGVPLDRVFHIINTHTRQRIEAPVQKVLSDGLVVGLANHTILIDREGREYQIADSAAPVRDAAGKITGVVMVFRDITEQYRMRQELQEREARYRQLVESTVAVNWEFCLEKDKWTYVGPQVTPILGWLPEEWTNLQFWMDNLHPEDREYAVSHCMACSNKGENHLLEYRFRTKEGGYVWLRDVVVVEMERGKAVKLRGIMLDINDRKEAEEALRRSEHYYRSLMNNLHEDIIVIDRDYRITDINRNALQTLGRQRSDVIGKHCHQLTHGLNTPCHEHSQNCGLPSVFASAEPCNLHHVHIRDDGEKIHIDLLCSPLLDEKGRVTHMIEAARDVSDLFAAQQAASSSEAKMESIFRASPIGIGLIINRVFVEVNDCFCRMTGYSREEMIGNDSEMLYPSRAEYEFVGQEKYRRIAEQGTASVETQFITKDGKMIDVLLSSTPLDVADLSVGVTFTALDITARKRGEAERERLLAAMEQAGEVVVITDVDGRIQYVNPAFEHVTGFSAAEVSGLMPSIVKSGKQDDTFYAEMWSTISSGKTWTGRLINRRKDGKLYTEEATISPVLDAAGNIVNYVAVKRDISEQLRLAAQFQQAQKMESVGRLAGGVAHDFNNMLGVIIGNAEMALDETEPTNPVHNDLQEILIAANRSADITRKLLAFARKQTIAPKVLDLNVTVEGMLKMLRRLIGEDIDLSWMPGNGLWPIKMDPAQIDQVLANLCVNARDAIVGVGKITIETNMVQFDEAYCLDNPGFVPGDFVLLAVSDNGCGMDRTTLDRLFEPFFTTKEVGKGTGLGLATVYGIVKQNNGFINVYSEPDKGTTIKIYLPRYDGQETDQIMMDNSADVPQAQGETVLIVEDEISILNLGASMLEKLGYRVLAAATPGQALELATTHPGTIDLLVTDVIMPDMNGRDLAGRLADIYPDLKTLFMSGYTANVIAHHGVLDKGVLFLQKPFSKKQLALLVRRALD